MIGRKEEIWKQDGTFPFAIMPSGCDRKQVATRRSALDIFLSREQLDPKLVPGEERNLATHDKNLLFSNVLLLFALFNLRQQLLTNTYYLYTALRPFP